MIFTSDELRQIGSGKYDRTVRSEITQPDFNMRVNLTEPSGAEFTPDQHTGVFHSVTIGPMAGPMRVAQHSMRGFVIQVERSGPSKHLLMS